jgi:MFS transporter, putative metabolite:H+ symporter
VGATYAYTPEAYPTNLRATGMGAASAWARIAGAIAPSLGAALSSGHFDLVVPLTVFAVAFVIAGLAALGLPRETASLPLADSLSAIGGNGTRADARQAS